MALPPLPPGFEVERPRKTKPLRLDDYTPAGDVADLGTRDPSLPPLPKGFELEATGEVVDGDTIRLTDKRNGRVLGFDAFEADQRGAAPDGSMVPIGANATSALDGYVTPQTNVRGIGASTYGRPVVTLGNDGTDPVVPMLRQGHGYAAPEYMKDDPARSGQYMEAERLGRLNRQGGFATEHMTPKMDRMFERGRVKLRPDEEIVWTSDVPDDKPELTRLTTEQQDKITAYLRSQAGKKDFSYEAYRDWFRNELGLTKLEPVNDPKFIEAVRNGEGFSSTIDYSRLDAEAMRKLDELIKFSGLRPEDARMYRDIASDPDATQEQLLSFAESRGLTLDPRDVAAYYKAREQGKDEPIPLPIINPGDGKTGAFARGFGDIGGALDEAGGLIDTIGGTDYRENIWNSDRSFGEIYDNNTRQNRAIIDYDETHHPYMRAGGQLVSGIAIPFGGGVRGAAGFAKAGAIEGGIYGFGSADGSLTDRLKNVPGNAAAGAVVGTVGGKAIEAATPIVAKGFQRIMGRGAEAVVDGTPASPVARADMATEGVDPSLVSPRVRDTIDVNGTRARPMGEGPTDAMMRAAASRVEPRDLLPRAANEVSSVDEAAAIGNGPYPEVTAPRERDYLETRQFPARNNPDKTVSQRGPVDLVSFARAQGGLTDEGGELAASGITNTPRQGDDFTGGERFLGRLVDDENGTSLDEFAQRAWKEGYFPELDSPPTIQQVVAALDDTYRGVGRRFRPDDEGQIQAFEAARDQRLAVERARQEGAPLVDDVGQPTTLDDLVRNTPPATAYDDWNNAVLSKVGNIRVNKLDSVQDISQALKIADNVAGGFDAARRGKISQEETKALARDLGMTADDLLTRRKGQALNAEEAYAARAILAKSGDELVSFARKIQRSEKPGDELEAEFNRALIRHVAIQEQVAGATAEAGRVLQQFRMAASSKDAPGRILAGLAGAGGSPKRIREAAEAIITLERDPASLNRFVEAAAKPKLSDKLVEVYYNFLLSGPATHAVNIMSNTMTGLAQIPEHGVASAIGKVRQALSKEQVDRVTFTESAARASGLMQGAREGFREIASRFRAKEGDRSGAWETAKRWGNAVADVEPADMATKIEAHSQRAVSGVKGKILRVPTSALTIEDEFFKAVARRSEMAGQAVRIARREGLKGEEGKRRAAELLANPTDEMWESALDYARYVTFQRPLGPVASHISAMTTNAPILKVVLPFVRTPTNIFKSFIEHSPAAPLLREWRKDFAAGGARRDVAVARVAVGSGMMAIVAEAAANGVITGSKPVDDNRAGLMLADGWQPYSIKIGDKYYSYQRLDPFALTIGAAADMATLGDGMSAGQQDKGASLIVASVVGNLSNKTWLSGVSDFMAALDDPQRYGDWFVKRFAGSALVPTGVAQIARTVDPTMRETDSVGEYVQSRVPGMSDDLLPKRDVWGRPIEKEGGLGPDIMSPIWTSTEKGDPATHEALRVGATISPPSDRVNGKKMPARVYDRLQAITGPLAHKWVSELIKQPDYRALDMDGQAKAIKYVMEKAREAAKANVMGGAPLPTSRPEKGQRRAPRGQATTPPLPPGFELAQ